MTVLCRFGLYPAAGEGMMFRYSTVMSNYEFLRRLG